MPSESEQNLRIPGFQYRGIDVPGLEIDVPGLKIPDYFSDPGVITVGAIRHSELLYELASNSVPLAWKAGLYLVGRDLALGIGDAFWLPELVKKAGEIVYSHAQKPDARSVVHKDAVLFEPGATIKGNTRPKGCIAAKYFKDIEGFDTEIEEIKSSPQTKMEHVWVPKGKGRFIVPTRYGAYHPVTGTPLETIEDREKAIKRWVDAGLTGEQASDELSRSYINGNPGTWLVTSSSNRYDGPFCIRLDGRPTNSSFEYSSFAAHRYPAEMRR